MLATPKRGEICRLATHLSNQSFPGFFKLGGKRGKKRFFAASTQKSKTVALNFYLLPKNTTLTPLPAEELELLQAGMGRKSVSMPETGDHSEITQVLTDTFPKMENLAGGWLLHKASGGSGRRKLTVIPPEAEGYSVKALRAVSTGGKAILFIVPLQERLDTSPLFLTDMIVAIKSRFFEGPGSQGKNPKYSVTDLDNENFRTVGEVIAVSLAQGGPPPAFFKEWCYNFLCNGEVDLRTLSQEDVTDLESCQLINNVENSTDPESLMVLIDDIVNCGYSSQIKLDNKKSIIRAVVLHSTTRLIPMLQQVRKGLELYGLLDQMAAHPEACYSLFVPGKIEKPDADFIMMHCKAEYSEKGTAEERAERRIMAFFQDFLEELEMSDVKEEEVLTVEHVLKSITGQAHIPILPDEKRHFKITVKFNHECIEQLGPHSVCYPTVSACSQTVTFPIQHLDTLNDFTRIMSEAVRYGGGFHRV
ncbi:G2/M phase-specific E3 ubiquitin-protein ligase-like isoform X2 [Sardina pilchardus]|uniref:G2/M phase-specific E3 ubiquitin-protein ligase-like isoform X2 n=1 Tax=Sardina pilchardus TaxID=27697 RepID=UPI002E159B34